MRSEWVLPICTGNERIKLNGKKAHSTQKPQALLYRVILSSTLPGDLVLDPFFGTGTTGVVAKLLHRRWIGIEQDELYVQLAQERIDETKVEEYEQDVFEVRSKRKIAGRVPFSQLLEVGLVRPGQTLYFLGDRNSIAKVKPDGILKMGDDEGSIHQLARQLTSGSPSNGWDLWYFENDHGVLETIDQLRHIFRKNRN